MPLAAQAIACYVAGLVLGGVANAFAAVVLCLIAAVCALFASRRALCALALLAATGVVVQQIALASQTRCLERVLHRDAVVARLLGDAETGSVVRAEIPACESELELFVVWGGGGRGAVVGVAGSPSRSRRG